MIIRILNSTKSAITSMRYNQDKVNLGLGSILTTNFMPSENEFKMEQIFIEREENPNLRNNAKKLGFHAVISPGPGEEMTDEEAKKLAKDYMQDLGYNDQPWILYKHEDIDRVHYHLVGSKVKLDGSIIYDSYSGLKTKKFIKEKGPQYGFVIGKDKGAPEQKIYVKRFTYTKGNIVSQMKHFYKLSLDYQYRSVEDFLTTMRAFGIRTDIRPDNSLAFIGLDKNGKTQGNYIGGLDKVMFSQITDHRSNSMDSEAVEDCRKAVVSCLEYSATEKEFLNELRKARIDCVMERDSEGRVKDMTFVDHANMAVFHMNDFGEKLTMKDYYTIADDWKEDVTYRLAANSRETSEFADLIEGLHLNISR